MCYFNGNKKAEILRCGFLTYFKQSCSILSFVVRFFCDCLRGDSVYTQGSVASQPSAVSHARQRS